MEFRKIFNQQENYGEKLKRDLNSYTFSQKLSRTTEKIEARFLTAEEKRNILNTTFLLGNKVLFNEEQSVSTSKNPTGYNLRYIELEFISSNAKYDKNIFERKIA